MLEIERFAKDLGIDLEIENNNFKKERPIKIKAYKVICEKCGNTFKTKNKYAHCKYCNTGFYLKRIK